MAVLTGARYFNSNKGFLILYGTTGVTTQDTTPDGVSIPDGSLYVLQSPQSLWQKISGTWVQVGGANTDITATSIIACNPTTGTNTYVTTAIPDPITQYDTNVFYQIPITIANTGSSTINIDGIGALPIKKILGAGLTNVVSGDITVSTIFVYYDGTNAVLQTGKEYVLYDNNGLPCVICLDAVIYFIQSPSLITNTVEKYVTIRDEFTGEILKSGINEFNAVYVNPNGVNSLGLKKSSVAQYSTISGANAYAQGDQDSSLIHISAGVYNTGTSPTFSNNKNYFLTAGALVEISAETDSGGATNIYIYGFGELRNPLNYSNASTIVNIILRSLYGNGQNIIVTSNCTLNIEADTIRVPTVSSSTVGGIDLTNNTFNIKASRYISKNVTGNTGNCVVIKISGGSGKIETDSVIAYTNFSAPATEPVINITGACGDVYIKANAVMAYATPASTTPIETYANMINVTNSSGTVILDLGTVYGGVNLQPTSTGKVKLYLKNKLIADISGGDALTIGASAMATGIVQNKKTNSGSTALKVVANNGTVMNLLCQGGEFSVKGSSAYTLNVVGTLSTDTPKNFNITINPTAAYIYNSSYSLY